MMWRGSQLQFAHRAVRTAQVRASALQKQMSYLLKRKTDQAIDCRKRSAGCQRVAHSVIVKSMGLIGVVATSILLYSAQSFQPAPSAYRAKQEDVPSWAEQG